MPESRQRFANRALMHSRYGRVASQAFCTIPTRKPRTGGYWCAQKRKSSTPGVDEVFDRLAPRRDCHKCTRPHLRSLSVRRFRHLKVFDRERPLSSTIADLDVRACDVREWDKPVPQTTDQNIRYSARVFALAAKRVPANECNLGFDGLDPHRSSFATLTA